MNLVVLLLFVIFGIIIISGYINLAVKNTSLWNGINNKTMRNIYIAMICLSSLCGIYLMYFYTTNDNKHDKLLYSGLLLLLIFSAVWAWAPFFHEKIILFIVALGAFLLLINNSMEFENNTKSILALIACIILFIQTFGFDFMYWSHAVF